MKGIFVRAKVIRRKVPRYSPPGIYERADAKDRAERRKREDADKSDIRKESKATRKPKQKKEKPIIEKRKSKRN
eukprot:TRINITY_DN1091_c0_g1_i1.p3 TRINITY_DN1091_c0_g1~~TRINITY_DN1091_c0_g1_i1.p3  ORF type:complete len:74 (-),score=22.62 TRINITY_DN1091_c0_g1_i1:53-274(-)